MNVQLVCVCAMNAQNAKLCLANERITKSTQHMMKWRNKKRNNHYNYDFEESLSLSFSLCFVFKRINQMRYYIWFGLLWYAGSERNEKQPLNLWVCLCHTPISSQSVVMSTIVNINKTCYCLHHSTKELRGTEREKRATISHLLKCSVMDWSVNCVCNGAQLQ